MKIWASTSKLYIFAKTKFLHQRLFCQTTMVFAVATAGTRLGCTAEGRNSRSQGDQLHISCYDPCVSPQRCQWSDLV